jgi:hypothetical protein
MLFAECYPPSMMLSQAARLKFENFDMNRVLANSNHLMASEGKEYEEEEYQGIVSF